jgi:2-dehydropantoate 2-reductase
VEVLVVGAGAVGVSYAHVFARAGARVSFFVRAPRVEQTRAGLALHELTTRGRVTTHELRPHEVLSTASEVSARRFDQVWLTVPSTALDGEWLPALCDAAGDATVVALQPGLRDRAKIADAAGEHRVVAGVIVLVAWQGGLPGEPLDGEGVRCWYPPLVPTPVSGERADAVRGLLVAGGVRARVVRDAAAQAAPGAALLQAAVAGVECAGWSLRAFARGPFLPLALRAGRQAAAIAAASVGVRPSAALSLARPWLLRLVTPLAPRVFPGDLEAYLRVHFTKVGAQTARAFAEYQERAAELGLPADEVRALADALTDARTPTA